MMVLTNPLTKYKVQISALAVHPLSLIIVLIVHQLIRQRLPILTTLGILNIKFGAYVCTPDGGVISKRFS